MFGGMGAAKTSEPAKPMNAKKLDINFDNDDFFNSFEPGKPAITTTAPPETNGNSYVTRLQEVNDPFDIVKPPSQNTGTGFLKPNTYTQQTSGVSNNWSSASNYGNASDYDV